ncbi:hypothetical protein [Glycomyces paridis]|nr:hypothetical protein [Glycomyces paridis]
MSDRTALTVRTPYHRRILTAAVLALAAARIRAGFAGAEKTTTERTS